MEHSIVEIFADGSRLQLSGLIGLALFFLIVGFREIRDEQPEGYLYLTLSLFFLGIHAFFLTNLPNDGLWEGSFPQFGFWTWLVLLLAPALITLFLLRGVFGFFAARSREGLVKVFFGLTLLCYLYMVGQSWPIDVKGILTIIWLTMLFKTELSVAQ